MSFAAILSFINLAMSAAPKVIDMAKNVKAVISGLFAAGKITKEQQDSLHSYVDALQAMSDAGIVPEHWLVRPDPVV